MNTRTFYSILLHICYYTSTIYSITIKRYATVSRRKKKTNYYIDNDELQAEMIKSLDAGRMTERCGELMITLAKHIASSGSYHGYTYIDDMQGFALETICKGWKSFDPEKYSNPFAYFTSAVRRAFWQYMARERKHRDIRDKALLKGGEDPSHTYVEQHKEDTFNVEFDNCIKLGEVTDAMKTLLNRMCTTMVSNYDMRKDVEEIIHEELLTYELPKKVTAMSYVSRRISDLLYDIDPTFVTYTDEDDINDALFGDDSDDDEYDV